MNYTLHFCSILFFFLVHLSINAQKIERIDPPFWWVDMENPTLELIVKGTELNDDVSIQADGVELVKSELSENKNYLFISLKIANSAQAQTLKLKSGKKTFKYQLKERSQENKQLIGLSPKDFIYLITPDRFANGNTKNDVIKGMAEDSVNRAEPYARHGGDIAGMHSKIDYLHDLGVTALWINPLLENDQPSASYHGYAITDHYQIDPRFGSNEDYKNFIDDCHKKGIKIIMDVIYNHFGSEHYLIKDLPEQSFINQWPEFTQTNYRATTLHDPYASEKDKLLMTDGWFDKHMPDMNQRNEHLANYLIQNSIWWIEEFGIDAFRIDTYAYPDQGFMSRFAQAIEKEYPQFFMFGETWVHGPQVQSWYAEKSANKNFDSHLQSVTDFQFAFALHKGLNEKHDWAKGINRLYYVLSGDYMYENPSHLVTFIDNHDIARIYGLYGKDMNKYKMAIALLMTSRGIPQMYYGTEILMAATDGHGEIREDFWGGWPEDTVNKFTKEGRSDLENEAFDFIQSLANFRKNSSALTEGKLVQFVPREGVYCYFRYSADEEIMVIVNASEKAVEEKLDRYEERLRSKSTFTDALTQEALPIEENLELGPFETRIFVVK